MSEKDKAKPPHPKNIPKDGQVIISIMKEMGITEYDPKTIVQLTEFVYRYSTSILEEARMYANNNPKKKFLDVEDVRLALQLTCESSFATPIPRDIILEAAQLKNYAPLPIVKPHCGLRLPPDRYCLSSCNYTLKTAPQKKPTTKTTYSIGSGATGIKITSKPNVSYIKRTNSVGVAKQTVTIPNTVLKPKIQIATNRPQQVQQQHAHQQQHLHQQQHMHQQPQQIHHQPQQIHQQPQQIHQQPQQIHQQPQQMHQQQQQMHQQQHMHQQQQMHLQQQIHQQMQQQQMQSSNGQQQMDIVMDQGIKRKREDDME